MANVKEGFRTFRDVTIGVDLNSMTSRSLIEYGNALKKDIATLEGYQNDGTISKQQKEELKAKLNTQKIVSHSLKRISDFGSALKKAGLDLGSLNDLSINTLAAKAETRVNSIEDLGKRNKIRKIVNKYRNSTTTVMGTSVAGTIVQGGLKVSGMVLLTTSAGLTLNAAVSAIGGIPLKGTQYANVAAWIGKNMPWLKGALITAFIGATFLVAAKKLASFSSMKNMAVADSMSHQLKAEEQREASMKGKSIDSMAKEAAADAHTLDLLKSIVKGKNIYEIINEGPASDHFTAEEYKAARILNEIDSQASETKQAAKSKVLSEAERIYTEVSENKTAIDKNLKSVTSQIANAEKTQKMANDAEFEILKRKQAYDQAKEFEAKSKKTKSPDYEQKQKETNEAHARCDAEFANKYKETVEQELKTVALDLERIAREKATEIPNIKKLYDLEEEYKSIPENDSTKAEKKAEIDKLVDDLGHTLYAKEFLDTRKQVIELSAKFIDAKAIAKDISELTATVLKGKNKTEFEANLATLKAKQKELTEQQEKVRQELEEAKKKVDKQKQEETNQNSK